MTEALDAPAPATLDRLSRLIDKSLLVPEQRANCSTRYGLLVTLRAYGHERLVEAGEEMDASDRQPHQASVETARPYSFSVSHAGMFALVRLADLASSEGQGDEARTMLREAIADVRDSGYHLADAVHWYGVAEVRQGEHERGVGMIAAAAGRWGFFGSPSSGLGISYASWARQQASLAEAREALPPDRFAQAWAHGERMGLEQAADLILTSAPRQGAQADEKRR